jgi:hypothetical protein
VQATVLALVVSRMMSELLAKTMAGQEMTAA